MSKNQIQVLQYILVRHETDTIRTTMDGDDQTVGNDTQDNFNFYNATCTAPAPSANERYEEWQNLIEELPTDLDEMGAAFVAPNSKEIVDGEKPFAALRHGNSLVHELIHVGEKFRESGLLDRWSELVKSIEMRGRSEEHTSELQSRLHLVCRLL